MTTAEMMAKRDELYKDYCEILEKDVWMEKDHEMMHYMAENMTFLGASPEK